MGQQQLLLTRQHIMWQWQVPGEHGLEYLELYTNVDVVRANSCVIGIADAHPFHLQYIVQCGSDFQLHIAELQIHTPNKRNLSLIRSPAGDWIDVDGNVLTDLHGCSEIDIEVSPFTNTLPIRRLALRPGQSTEIYVAYIAIPALDVRPERQRYTFLAETNTTQLYRYESLTSGFTAEIVVDHNGLIIEYPGIFTRVWPTAI
ncbi:MAG: putative glycolipid-binding domain-containing protein [Chloroflexota bacterium]